MNKVTDCAIRALFQARVVSNECRERSAISSDDLFETMANAFDAAADYFEEVAKAAEETDR